MTHGTPRVRERLPWYPDWEHDGNDYTKWSKGFIQNHKWRTDRINGADDLLQEAWITFNYVANSYPRCLCPKHFMALFKRAMVNKMHDRSCRVKRRRNTPEGAISLDVYEVFAGRMGEVTNAGYASLLVDEMPEELKLIMQLLANGEIEPDQAPKKDVLKPRKTLNMKVKEYLNKKGAFNAFALRPVDELKQLLV